MVAIVRKMLESDGYRVGNVDCTVICKAPVLAPWRDRIAASLAGVLGVSRSAVSVKGKSGNGIGAVGEGKAVAALAVCLLEKA
jgi:2-C-methyl-D-erythritol 2,4-cyclodiphosphate synthase